MESIFLQGPANTTSYMIAGFTVIFGVMLLFILSLVIRARNLNQDLEVLQELELADFPESNEDQ
jgi:hypothetical protein